MAQPPYNHLLSLPVETLHHIADYLESNSLGAFRSTCRALDATLFTRFATKAFSRKKLGLTWDEVVELVEFSKSRASRFLDRIDFYTPNVSYLSDSGSETEEEPGHRAQNNYYGEQLREAFSNLREIQTVVLRDHVSVNRSWTRPPVKQILDSDSLTVFRKTGTRPKAKGSYGDSDFETGKYFSTLIESLSEAGTRVKHLEVCLVADSTLEARDFTIHNRLKTSVVAFLENLERLHIVVDVEEVDEFQSNLGQFLSYASNLKDLRINGYHNINGVADMNSLVYWLGRSSTNPPTGISPEFVDFSRLETLSLGKMTIFVEGIHDLICKYASTLKTLEFWLVTIPDTDGTRNVDEQDSSEEQSWPGLCRKIADIENLNLDRISIGKPLQYNTRSAPTGDVRVEVGVGADFFEHTGTGLKEFLRGLAEDMYCV
ncbi:hypothetical protein CDD82_6999 [Ophiocordyceps australis]|uniref:F-box domain-containing protein n=1 Tax=Ophiocordyceps australis TaxID=1399860 RepID=A0A2C5XFK9_9HYPO|nr:hypothetical protein CDD82_6999 [Ophiocordyceps australis]